MKTFLKVLGWAASGVVVLALGVYGWAHASSAKAMDRSVNAHAVTFPVPVPLSAEEADGMSQTEAESEALTRAIERGRHLVSARYACGECHGANFGGGVMVDAFPLGSFLGPNLTTGAGSVVLDYTPADWDRIVRHGILPDGRPALMPSEDFLRMSDQELSDIVGYLQSIPPVDNEVPPSRVGPLGRILIATGQIHFSADLIDTHDGDHAERPPPAEVSLAFGEHLAGVCTGCHGMALTGGPISGGDPAWPEASNLTPHPTGLEGWTLVDFRRAMLEGRRPDGSEIIEPMSLVTPFARRMTEVEMEALWLYLTSLEGMASGT